MAKRSDQWYGILEAVRRIAARKHEFTVHDLVDAARIADGGTATAAQIASAWLAKFTNWGYVVRAGQLEQPGRKPLGTYSITEEGRRCELRSGVGDRMTKLVAAVRAYQRARGTKNEPAAFAEMVRTCDEAGT